MRLASLWGVHEGPVQSFMYDCISPHLLPSYGKKQTGYSSNIQKLTIPLPINKSKPVVLNPFDYDCEKQYFEEMFVTSAIMTKLLNYLYYYL